MGELLERLAERGRAILMVEHDMDLVMNVCGVIHVLEFGKVIATGTAAEIRSDRKVQAAYLGFSDDVEVPGEVADQATQILGTLPRNGDETAPMPAVRTEAR
jgi:branched-chain amino acid transport system ATP-binding protein